MLQANELKIYKEIKKAILNQQLLPNVQLVEDVLAESFGVSRTPVRNVLRRLAHEKLVKIIPHKGTFVSSPTVDEAIEVFEMRKVLETAAIKQACERIRDDQFQPLELMIIEEHKAREEGDLFKALQISCDFHLEIAKIAGNSYFYRYIEELISLNYVIMTFYGYRQLSYCNFKEHADIIHAMKQRDGERASLEMLEHLNMIESYLDFEILKNSSMDITDLFKTRG